MTSQRRLVPSLVSRPDLWEGEKGLVSIVRACAEYSVYLADILQYNSMTSGNNLRMTSAAGYPNYSRTPTWPSIIILAVKTTAAMNSLRSVCRFCLRVAPSKHLHGLFTTQGKSQDLPGRLSKLLLVPVVQDDGMSQYICRTCKSNAIILEQKMHEMQERALISYQTCKGSASDVNASCSTGSAMLPEAASLPPVGVPISPSSYTTRKRTKDTSSCTGISPFTAQSRPQSKRRYSLTSKRLFDPNCSCKFNA